MKQVRQALLVAGIDLRRRLRNRSFLIQAVVGPVVLASIISLAFGRGVTIDATIGLVDADGSPISAAFVDGLADVTVEDLRFDAVPTAEQATALVDDGELDAAIVVPAGFGASTGGAGPPLELEVLTSSDAPIAGEVARSVAEGFTARVTAARLAAAATMAAGGERPADAELADLVLPIDVAVAGSGGDVSPAAYFGPSMGLLFLFLTVGTIARDLLAERRLRLLDRVRAAPVRDAAILSGKAIGVVVLGVATLAVIWGVTSVALGASWGAPAGVALLIVTVSVSIAGLSGVVAAVARTEQGADVLASFTAFAFALIGGNFLAPGTLPDAMRRLSLLTPNGWAVQGFAELAVGEGTVVDVLPHAAVLVAWGVGAAVVAALLLPRRIEGRT